MSYRNIVYNNKESTITLFTWNEAGERIKYDTTVEPYLYVEGPGNFESIFGTKLIRKKFNNQYSRYKFVKDNGLKKVFENLPAYQQFLVDNFWQLNEEDDFNTNPIKTNFVDIETYSPDAFPDIKTANHPITVITVYDSLNDEFVTWGKDAYENTQDDVTYYHCPDERSLLMSFVEHHENDYPDILSGWNSEFFDIPYIINRIRRLLGDDWVDRLSPVGRVYDREIRGQFGKDQTKWYIEGVSLLDYLDVYKKFARGMRESYKLDAIGEFELNQKKVDIGNMNLATLTDNDWQTFVDYNIQDVRLLKNLEVKLKYIDLVVMLAYTGLSTFEAAMGSLTVINGATAIRARRRGQIIPTYIRGEDTGKNPGAYVGTPLGGFQKDIMSVDANSLYPNVMISLNISPETKLGHIEDKNDKEVTIRHVNGKTFVMPIAKFGKFVRDEQIAISRSNVMFTQKKKGVMPEILDEYYDKRVEIQKELKTLKVQLAQLDETMKAIS